MACSEEKFLYRLISGIQTTINMHNSKYFTSPDSEETYRNYTVFNTRIGQFKERVENLYFTYHFVLSALTKLKGDLLGYEFSHQNKTENAITKNHIIHVFEKLSMNKFVPMNEGKLFSSVTVEEFLKAVQPVFYNVTQLADCVT